MRVGEGERKLWIKKEKRRGKERQMCRKGSKSHRRDKEKKENWMIFFVKWVNERRKKPRRVYYIPWGEKALNINRKMVGQPFGIFSVVLWFATASWGHGHIFTSYNSMRMFIHDSYVIIVWILANLLHVRSLTKFCLYLTSFGKFPGFHKSHLYFHVLFYTQRE